MRQFIYKTVFILVASSTCLYQPLIAQQTDISKLDSILDRLERRLLDQESDGLTYGERARAQQAQPDIKPGTSYQYKSSKIQASTGERDAMKTLSNEIADLESQVDLLASQVQKTKQQVLNDSDIDNFVNIDAQLLDTDTAALKSLTVKLDGFNLYEINDAAGLWLPAKSIPLYSGPMQPGSHRIDVEARLVVRHKKSMPLNGDVYRFVNKSFNLAIPGGTSNTRYVLSITPPDGLDGVVEASLKEAF